MNYKLNYKNAGSLFPGPGLNYRYPGGIKD